MLGSVLGVEGEGPPWEKEHPQAARLLKALKSSFDLASHAYLTSCTKKEFGEIFGHFDQQQIRRLWNLYKQVVAAMHQKCQTQLLKTVRERKVAEFLLFHGELERVAGGHDVTMPDGQDTNLQAARESLCLQLADEVKLVQERARKVEAENALGARLLEIRREDMRKQIEEIKQQWEARFTYRAEEVDGCAQAFSAVGEYLAR